MPNLAAGQGTAASPATLSATSTVNQASFTDAKNQTTRFETDALGRITKQTDALNRVTTITRDARANPHADRPSQRRGHHHDLRRHGESAHEHRSRRLPRRRRLYEPTFNQGDQHPDPQGTLTQIAYDAKGNLLTITDALNQSRPSPKPAGPAAHH